MRLKPLLIIASVAGMAFAFRAYKLAQNQAPPSH